ncbi:uracil-5-carboxylate decarboxylase [Phytophthora cinnamomi]|uniref:uracil-5-carboxylate decarboxylase n=1 Tax=Phytophthora cinnamomi TaxID=4785 RepID=UPI00355A0A7A|nr:uracil-5-carboxylate decarboxylase [Phytophthora cinnamomi]
MPRALSKLLASQGKASVRDLDAVDLHTHVYLPRYMDILRARKDVPFVRPGVGGERLIILPAEQQQLEQQQQPGGISAGRPIGGEYWDASNKLCYMDRHGIRTSVLSLANPWLDFLPLEEQICQATLLNDDMEMLCRGSDGRFLAFGVVPQDSTTAVKEVERLSSYLPHVRGVILSTAGLNGKGLDDPGMLEFYRAMDRAGLTIFLHPHYGVGNKHYGKYGHALFLALGFTFETTVAVSQLVLSGLLDQVPDTLRLLLAHSGGTLPFLAGRLDSCVEHDAAIAQNLQHAPSVYLKRFYYDAVAYHEPALQCLIDFVGADKIVFGTDHPFFPPAKKGVTEGGEGEDLSEVDWRSTLSNYEIMAKMSKEVQSAMLRDNAKRLMGI